jgi:type IV pilus assembly protein PilM
MARTRIGLDIGSTSVRAAELAFGSSLPAVTRIAQVPLPPGAVDNGEIRDVEQVAEGIRELWRRGGFRSREVTLGVGNQRVVVREVSVPALPEKELKQSLPFQVQEMIPIPIEEAVLDYDVLDEVETEGRKMLRLMIVAAQRDMVDQHMRSAVGAKLEPVGVDLVPFALVRSVGQYEGLGLDEAEAGGEAVVDVGADVTNICVHERGVPRFVRILPSGGNDVTTAVAGALGVPEEQAEIFKRGGPLGSAPPSEEARRTLEQRAGALVDEIRSSLDFFRAQTPGAQVSRIQVTGGGSKMPGFIDLLGRRMGAPVERGHAFSKVQVQVALSQADLAEAEPLLAVAIGLALPQEGGR